MERLGSWARSAFFYSSSVLLGLAFLGALVAANFITAKRSPTWDLTAKPVEGDKTRFTCRIGYRMNPIYYVLARFCLAIGFFMEAHCEEETPHFANFAARFAMRNAPDRRESYLLPKNQVS